MWSYVSRQMCFSPSSGTSNSISHFEISCYLPQMDDSDQPQRLHSILSKCLILHCFPQINFSYLHNRENNVPRDQSHLSGVPEENRSRAQEVQTCWASTIVLCAPSGIFLRAIGESQRRWKIKLFVKNRTSQHLPVSCHTVSATLIPCSGAPSLVREEMSQKR